MKPTIGPVIGVLTTLAAATSMAAQGAQDSTDRFTLFYRYAALVQGGRVTPHWSTDGRWFWFVERRPDSVTIQRVDAAAAIGPLFDLARLRRALRATLGREPEGKGVPFDSVRLVGPDQVEFDLAGARYSLTLPDHRITRLPAIDSVARSRTTPRLVRKNYPVTDPDTYELPSPDGKWFAFERNQNVMLRAGRSERVVALTSDGRGSIEWILDNLDWGLGETKGGARWSPDGRKLAALRRDTKGVIRIPVVHWLGQNETIEWQWYPKTGQPIARQEVYIIDVPGGRRTRIDLGDVTDRFTSIIGWLPNGRDVIVARMDRDYKRLDFFAANTATGRARLLVSEQRDTFIKGIEDRPGLGGLFHLLPDGKQFLMVSERDGWDHLYLYQIDGKPIRRITTGSWPVTEVVAIDQERGWVYFLGHAESRIYDTHLYRVRLDGSGFQRLTEGRGEHQIAMSPDHRYFLDTHSSIDTPPVVTLHAADGRRLVEVSRADISGLVRAGWRPPEEFWVKAADGKTDLRGVLYHPPGFDPARRYPVVEYIYGGPQLVNAPRAFLGNANALAVSQLGFVTLVLDARGTPERGKAFQDVVYGNFGRNEIPDHAGAIRQLAATRPYLDLERVGIFGGSWGGYMTIRALVLAPDLYRAGISIYPVGDLINHHQMIEAYMGRLERNRAGYEYASSLRLSDRIRGKLMLVHGTSDVNAPFSATMQIVQALIRAGKRHELVVFPEQNHSILPENVPYWLEVMKTFWLEHLAPQAEPVGR